MHPSQMAIVLVEQNLEAVRSLSHQVYIMVNGAIVHPLPTAELSLTHPLVHDHLGVSAGTLRKNLSVPQRMRFEMAISLPYPFPV